MYTVKFRNKDSQFSLGVIAACFLLVTVLVLPSSVNTEPSMIPIIECELNGFSLGGTTDQMREALGEPEPISIAMSPGNEYPHREFRYEGLRIVFSTHGRSALSYFISSDKYRLRSGVGVGSTRREIASALGSTGEIRSGGVEYMIYLVTGSDGRPVPAHLTFKLDREVAVEFSVVTR